MNKLIPLLLGLMFPLTVAFAANSANMDAANQTIINTCKSEGGTFISHKDGKCEYSGCAYIGTNGDVRYDGDNERITGGCSMNDYRNKAKADYKAELDKRIRDLEDAKKQADKIGARGGDPSGYVDASSGDGRGGSPAGANDGRGGTPAGANDGRGGSPAGANSGDDSGEAVICEELEGQIKLEPGMACYKECKARRRYLGLFGPKEEGAERESCLKCLGMYPDIYTLKPQYRAKYSKEVSIGTGVATVKTGVIVCKDAKGNVVSVRAKVCPTGTSLSGSGGLVVSGSVGTPSASGNIVISGGASASGGITRPAYCDGKSKKDLELCAEWMRVNRRFLCSSSGNSSFCMDGADADIRSRYSVTDCVNCGPGSRQQSTWSGVAEVIGALAPVGVAYLGGRAQIKSAEAYANGMVGVAEQCRLSQNDYRQYLSANELPGLTPAQQAAMNCNGYGLSGYAGLQSGGLQNWYQNGYTPGFISGMIGPYGPYNPYLQGGIAGSISIAGGYYQGGFNQGGLYQGGYQGFAQGGYQGFAQGGYQGFAQGGYQGFNQGGYLPGGYQGFAQGGYQGFNQGGYLPGGYQGFAQGGYQGFNQGGYLPGGYQGFAQGGYQGFNQGGYLPGGYQGYAQGGYQGFNQGGFQGGYNQGGYMPNPQATNYDRMMQQQGTMYQMGNMGGGSAMYNPMNAGFTLGGSIGIGGGVNW